MSHREFERIAALENAVADLCSYYARKHFDPKVFEEAMKVVRATDPNNCYRRSHEGT